MFELAKKYSGIKYYSKTDLKEEVEDYVVEPIWQEIVQYRKLFEIPFSIHGQNTYLIQAPFVQSCMIETYQLLLKNALQQTLKYPSTLDLSQIPVSYHKAIHALCKNVQFSMEEQVVSGFYFLLKQYCREMQKCMPTFYDLQDQVLLHLFYVGFEKDATIQFLMLHIILQQYQMLHFFQEFNVILHRKICNWEIHEKDLTKKFLHFLSCVRFHFSKDMIPLDRKDKKWKLESSEEKLIKSFPMLQKQQIQFYVAHRNLRYYYTLKDYMSFHEVCYETARTAMEQLVQMEWYQKIKIGKKFVYFIV